MTIGIGLVCDQGKHILLAADMRGSYGDKIPVTTNDQTAKLFDLPANYCGVVAGLMSQCTDVISELHHQMTKFAAASIAPERVRKCIEDSYESICLPLADQALRNELKITLDDYKHDKKLVAAVRRDAREVLKALVVDVDLIVAGFYQGGPVQIVAQGGTSVVTRSEVSPGNAVIGSGAMAALNWLNFRKQNLSFGLAHSFFHLTEAKQFAEIEQTVGPVGQMMVLWSGGWKGLEGGRELIQSWWDRYGVRVSDGLEEEKHNQAVHGTFGLGN